MRLALFIIISISAFSLAVNPAEGRPPNVVFVLADDLGWAELGCYGSNFNETPCLDQLARQGVRMTHAYAAAPVCSPYRASLLTGQYLLVTEFSITFVLIRRGLFPGSMLRLQNASRRQDMPPG